jgi:DNA-binding CsgD family transcriptional regulator
MDTDAPSAAAVRSYRGAVSGSRVTSTGHAAAHDRIVGLASQADDARALRLDVLEVLRRAVGFDAYAWVLTDPVTWVGASPLADVPWLPELPRQIRLKYLTTVNRWTSLGADRVALLDAGTGGDLSQSLVWRELLDGYAVRDVASVVYVDRFGCWAFLELWRTDPRRPFTPADGRLLAAVAEPLTDALRRCRQLEFMVSTSGSPRRTGPVLLLLSPGLTVQGQTPESMAYLRALVPPAEGAQPVPAVAYNVAAQLLAVEAGVDGHAPVARVSVGDGVLMTARAARLEGVGQPPDRDIAVTIEDSTSAERVDLFSRAFRLTPREAEVLGHLVTGIDTRDVAARMFLSQNTVQDHLKSIFAKTQCRSRRALLARALGA